MSVGFMSHSVISTLLRNYPVSVFQSSNSECLLLVVHRYDESPDDHPRPRFRRPGRSLPFPLASDEVSYLIAILYACKLESEHGEKYTPASSIKSAVSELFRRSSPLHYAVGLDQYRSCATHGVRRRASTHTAQCCCMSSQRTSISHS